jgi:hypothetical protein
VAELAQDHGVRIGHLLDGPAADTEVILDGAPDRYEWPIRWSPGLVAVYQCTGETRGSPVYRYMGTVRRVVPGSVA